MPSLRVRSASIYLDGKKAASLSGTLYHLETGDQLGYDGTGVCGFMDGVVSTRLTATGVHPLTGSKMRLFERMVAHEDIDIAVFPIDGGVHTISMRCISGDAASEHRSGTQKASYVFIGGAPAIS